MLNAKKAFLKIPKDAIWIPNYANNILIVEGYSRNLICINMFFKQFLLLVYFLILKYCLEFSETFCIKHFDESQYRL